MRGCPACGARLETPLGCNACGVLLRPADDPSPFEVLGLEPTWEVNKTDLKKRLLRFSRLLHPDFHGISAADQKELAEANSARLNRAYEIVLDDFLRADWLVAHLDGPTHSDERQMPAEFLIEVLEWNEALDEAQASPPDSPERGALEQLVTTLNRQHEGLLAEIGRSLTPLPGRDGSLLSEIRRQLNAVRYLSRTLFRIRDLRFGEAPSA